MTEPNVKILISCHKDVLVPKSDVFLPVEVGAVGRTAHIDGFQRDDTGENISDRNFTFCELTAQYWAWKNLDADYYGLCHYRRYFCFDGQGHPANDHGQIEAESLSEYSLRDYRIADDGLIRAALADCDLVTPPYWDVKQAPTPCGPQKTIQSHMVSYGLYTNEDAALLRSIIAERQPDYLASFDAYMGGSKYLGYSCYIMKKDLFQRFCAFEFDVLQEFDSRFDYAGLTTTHKRLCGYFGEVLYSVFVAKVQQERLARIKQVPLVFFDDTSCTNGALVGSAVAGANDSLSADAVDDSAGADAAEPVRVFWRYSGQSAVALTVCLESLLANVDAAKRYEITLLYSNFFELVDFNAIKPVLPENVSLKLTNWSNMPLCAQLADFSLADLDIVQPLVMPWLLTEVERFIWVGGLATFQSDPAALLEQHVGTPYWAINNALLQRELNKPETQGRLAPYGLEVTPEGVLDTTFMVVDAQAARNQTNPSSIADALAETRSQLAAVPYDSEVGKPLTVKRDEFDAPGYSLGNQAFRAKMLRGLDVQALSFAEVSSSLHEVDAITWLNEELAQEWKAAVSPVAVYWENGKAPELDANQRFASAYWKYARTSAVYELALLEALEPKRQSLKNRLFPRGTKRREIAVRTKRLLGR